MEQNELFWAGDYDCNNYNHKNDPYYGEKVGHEIHRMMGLLRFTPNKDGVFVARCAPDYFILPALAAYFMSRFGETPWEIIDEKRGLRLLRRCGEKPRLIRLENNEDVCLSKPEKGTDEWEELWKHYHKTIDNEERHNPALQRQFMPQRYWKYLPEKELD